MKSTLEDQRNTELETAAFTADLEKALLVMTPILPNTWEKADHILCKI